MFKFMANVRKLTFESCMYKELGRGLLFRHSRHFWISEIVPCIVEFYREYMQLL